MIIHLSGHDRPVFDFRFTALRRIETDYGFLRLIPFNLPLFFPLRNIIFLSEFHKNSLISLPCFVPTDFLYVI